MNEEEPEGQWTDEEMLRAYEGMPTDPDNDYDAEVEDLLDEDDVDVDEADLVDEDDDSLDVDEEDDEDLFDIEENEDDAEA